MEKERADKNQKFVFFAKWDIAIYIFVFLLLALSVAVVFSSNGGKLEGIEIEDFSEGKLLARYSFLSERLETFDEKVSYTELSDRIEIEIKNGDDRNLLIIEKGGKAYMKETNCSRRADCLYGNISHAGDSIICLPHKIEIRGIGESKGEVVIG